MSESAFETLHLSDVEPIDAFGVRWKPIRRRLGIEAFGVNAYVAEEPGEAVIEEHDETGSGAGKHEELYVVLAGHALFTVAGEEVDAPAGTLVFVRDPAARRGATAKAAGTTVLAVGGRRGAAYEVSPWESYGFAQTHVRAGDFAAAVDAVAAGLAHHPDNPSLLYNLACYEALAGRADDAVGHLGRALELDATLREYVASDSDLDSIRDRPDFPL